MFLVEVASTAEAAEAGAVVVIPVAWGKEKILV
jgi:hypothetical protein